MATISLPVATILCCDYGSDTGRGGNLRENNINWYMSGEYVIAPGEIMLAGLQALPQRLHDGEAV